MPKEAHICQCPHCQQKADHPDKEYHRRINLFLSRLDEQQRRWYVALESNRIGYGGDSSLSQITGMSRKTIRRGHNELADSLAARPADRVRAKGGGQLSIENRYPTIEAALNQILTNEIAGDPMSDQKWVRSSLRQLSQQLEEKNYTASPTTVRRLLKKLGFSMKGNVNSKKGYGSDCPQRDEQFQHIASQRQAFSATGLPIISVDTKKKELIGEFKNSGEKWCKQAEEVLAHDFPSAAVCRAVLYGIYDVTRNLGYVYVGTSNDTPEFAVDVIARWWRNEGCATHPATNQLLILADSGGCNGCRVSAWKQQLQVKVCDQLDVTVTVCHYPTGCSKWNPVEHRLFSYISLNWAGTPLKSLEVMLGYIRGTSTKTGLQVKAFLQEGNYKRGQRVTKAEMEGLNLQPHTLCPDWNYTIRPRQGNQ